jgi:hypothetical protein
LFARAAAKHDLNSKTVIVPIICSTTTFDDLIAGLDINAEQLKLIPRGDATFDLAMYGENPNDTRKRKQELNEYIDWLHHCLICDQCRNYAATAVDPTKDTVECYEPPEKSKPRTSLEAVPPSDEVRREEQKRRDGK